MNHKGYVLSLSTILFVLSFVQLSIAQHNPGADCFSCHSTFKIAGTVYSDSTGKTVKPGIPVKLIAPSGGEIILDNTNSNGNIAAPIVPDGSYIISVGDVKSRTWHSIPQRGSCNTCHTVGGSIYPTRTKKFHPYHTQIPSDNNCRNCHYFPASMSYDQLATPGVLNIASLAPPLPGSRVEILNQAFTFDPNEYQITTTRPDVFAPGYFSAFDVILAVALKKGFSIEYRYDDSCKTHWITKVNGISGKYWYGFSYDAGQGSGNVSELKYKRANRWDEVLWRSGVWVRLSNNEDVDAIRKEYLEEIERERTLGNVIPSVTIRINPSNYKGNPEGSGRITVSKTFSNLKVTPHNIRSTGYPTPYSKPFQPGVITSMDILYTLKVAPHAPACRQTGARGLKHQEAGRCEVCGIRSGR